MGFLDKIQTSQAAQQSPAKAPPKGVSPYAGLGATAASKKRQYLLKGKHVLEIIQVNDGNLPDEIGGQFFFAADFRVLESTNPDMLVGQERSWMTRRGKFPIYFLQDIKGFMAAAAKVDASQIGDDMPSEATAEGNPMAGFKLIADTFETKKVNPETGEKYLNTKFEALPEA